MRTIVEYTVICGINSGVIVDAVYEHIKEGWQPFGGICIAYERNIHRELGPGDINLPNDFEHVCQAMVKYAEED